VFNVISFLEYVPGGTISELLRQHGRFREEVTTSFLRQILQGLNYLHSSNILHRVRFHEPFNRSGLTLEQDLKADNILVEESGVCKISDFGISKKAEDLSHGGRAYTMMKGTVYWMAPEVLSSSDGQGYDAKVDIWSVGCVAVEMWTGTRPWSGYQTAPVMMKVTLPTIAHPPS
jgi:mitogen-activated protein kinase kinase kinase